MMLDRNDLDRTPRPFLYIVRTPPERRRRALVDGLLVGLGVASIVVVAAGIFYLCVLLGTMTR